MNDNIRDRASLVAAVDQGQRFKYLSFWGHKPSGDGALTPSVFSQWWQGHPFDVDGVSYRTAEHFMMAEKARLFDDGESAQHIIACTHPAEAKKLGRGVRGFGGKDERT